MNCTQNLAEQFNYPIILNSNALWLNNIYGYCEIINAYDTYQFTDYSKYDCDVFDENIKTQVRNTQFPQDLEKSYNLGKKLAEMNGGK